MGKVLKFTGVQHVYEVDRCAGCGIKIENEYLELGLPSADDKEMKHIALCEKCEEVADSYGVLPK